MDFKYKKWETLDEYYDVYQSDELDSSYLKTRGTLEWFDSGEKSRFNRLFTEDISELHKEHESFTYLVDENDVQEFTKYWLENPIEYKFNSMGFRDDEFDSKPNEIDVYLGDSHTSGLGLHRYQIWPTIVASKLNFPNINAGVAGAPFSLQYRILNYLVKRFKIRNLLHYTPHLNLSNWEFWNSTENEYESFDENYTENLKMNVLFSDMKNICLQNHGFIYAIKQVCSENNINYVGNVTAPDYISSDVTQRRSRDLFHKGVAVHKIIADSFLQKMNIPRDMAI